MKKLKELERCVGAQYSIKTVIPHGFTRTTYYDEKPLFFGASAPQFQLLSTSNFCPVPSVFLQKSFRDLCKVVQDCTTITRPKVASVTSYVQILTSCGIEIVPESLRLTTQYLHHSNLIYILHEHALRA